MRFNLLKSMTVLTLAMVSTLSLSAQNLTVQGTVTDQYGEPAIGAGVFVAGTTNGTVTDLDGHYTITAPSSGRLTVSNIGFVSQTVDIAGRTQIDFVLQEDREILDEVVVVGYGVQKKSDVTGSIASVKSDDLRNRSNPDVASMLQGKAAGVQAVRTSGAPGAVASIRVRGVSSNGNSEPLFIVDGLKVADISYLDPENIESMEILKDAASAAIYGAEAGNGVVMITTKTAKNGQGHITFNAQYGVQTQARKAKMLNAEQYITFMSELGAIDPILLDNYYYNDPSVLVNGKLPDTDWQKEYFDKGVSQRYNLSFEGGNDRASVYIGLGYSDIDGMVKYDFDTYKRLSLQMNASYKVTDWLRVGTTNTLEKHHLVNLTHADATLQCDPLTPVEYVAGITPVHLQRSIDKGWNPARNPFTGNYAGQSVYNLSSSNSNPFGMMFASAADPNDAYNEAMNLNGTVFGELSPVKNLVFTTRLGYRVGNIYSYTYSAPYCYNEVQYKENESVSSTAAVSLFYQWENFVNYSLSLGKHTVSAMAGMSYIRTNYKNVTASTQELSFSAPNYRYLDYSTSDAEDSVGGTIDESGQLSYFGRLGWSYEDKYNVMANFRADAYDSSKLDKHHRWGYFPSVSAGWTVSREPFMQEIAEDIHMDFLKIRASWGINGSISNLNGYQYASTLQNGYYYYMTDHLITGTYPSSYLANPLLRWEESRQWDAGMDMRFFRSRLNVGIDYYNKNTDGLLISSTSNLTTGTSTIFQNVGVINNHGLEMELSWRDQIGDFGYTVSGNFSMVNNKITSYKGEGVRLAGDDIHGVSSVTVFEEGYPVWDIYGYKFIGVNASDGSAIFEDVDGDGIIDESDRQHLGSAIPKGSYGLTINLNYKGFDLSVFGNGNYGGKRLLNNTRSDYPQTNRLAFEYTDRWTSSNTSASRPKPVNDIRYYASSAWVFDTSFFRISQIQLGYTLPGNWVKKVAMDSLRLYVSLENYFLFTNYPGIDPEVTSGATSGMAIDTVLYPQSKNCIFGVNVIF